MGLEYKKMETSFSNAVVLNVEPTADDLILLDAKPWLLMEMHLGILTTGLSFVKANMTHYTPCNEGTLATDQVKDMVTGTPYTVDGYTPNCRTVFKNTNYGVNNLLYKQNTNGDVTAIMPVGELAVDDGGKHVNFQIIIGDTATIQYVCTGLFEDLDGSGLGLGTYTQRLEKRILEYGINEITKYSINGVQQAYVPSLPSQDQLVLNNVALIGHPDTVTSINSATETFQYYSVYGALI